MQFIENSYVNKKEDKSIISNIQEESKMGFNINAYRNDAHKEPGNFDDLRVISRMNKKVDIKTLF